MDADETKILPNSHSNIERKKTENEPFEFGERTILNLRNQDFHPEDEFGTVVSRPQPHDTEPAQVETPEEGVEAPAQALSDDPLVRVEQKLDAALRHLQSMQQRLESIDATIAKALLR
jgi:hypothetical protein